MDGKTGAEELIAKILKDPSLLAALAAAPKPAEPPAGSADSAEKKGE
jgi:type VI secretion system protein ImpB